MKALYAVIGCARHGEGEGDTGPGGSPFDGVATTRDTYGRPSLDYSGSLPDSPTEEEIDQRLQEGALPEDFDDEGNRVLNYMDMDKSPLELKNEKAEKEKGQEVRTPSQVKMLETEHYKIPMPSSGIDEGTATEVLNVLGRLEAPAGEVYDMIQAIDLREVPSQEEAQARLRQEFGVNFMDVVEKAQANAWNLLSDAELDWLDESGLGDHPEIIKLFSRLKGVDRTKAGSSGVQFGNYPSMK